MNDKWNIHADKYGKYYEIKTDNGYYTFISYDDAKSYYSKYYGKYYGSFDPVESEEEKNERLARERAEERERKINILLGE